MPNVQRSLIQLLHLHSLEVDTLSTPGRLFPHLLSPALRHLQVGNCIGWGHSEFISFLSRSQCSLQKLVLRMEDIHISDADLIHCLEHTPDLVELELLADNVCEVPSSALSRLTFHTPENGQATCLAPKLKILELLHHSKFDGLAFVKMIQSRWWPEGALERKDNKNMPVERMENVVIRLFGDVEEDWDEPDPDSPLLEFQKFREEGLNIDVHKMFMAITGLVTFNPVVPPGGQLLFRE
jgi:hypothetical protein